MTLLLRVRPEAEQDIEEAATWYEQQRLGLGHEFLDEVLRVFEKLSEQPALYPEVHRKICRALTRRRHASEHLQASRMEETRANWRYAIVIEKAESNYSACVPDLPGACRLGQRSLKLR
jgi:plasmid stabilization system protein ParE